MRNEWIGRSRHSNECGHFNRPDNDHDEGRFAEYDRHHHDDSPFGQHVDDHGDNDPRVGHDDDRHEGHHVDSGVDYCNDHPEDDHDDDRGTGDHEHNTPHHDHRAHCSAFDPPTTVPSTPSSAAPTTSTTTVPGPASFDTTCSQPATPNLQTYLDSLPDGSVFRSSTTACYLVPLGIVLTHPITIVGGTFYDTTDTRTAGTLYNSLEPIILIKGTSRVSLSGVTAMGTNIGGDFAHRLVGQAGIKIMSSNNVTLTDVTAKNTYGDGLELVANFGNPVHTPVTGLSVEGFTTINAGRQGVTLAEVSSSVLNHVNVINPADAGFDFESDLAGVGSDNVTISNCTDTAGFRLNEFFSGPINITGCTGFHHVSLISPTSNAPITFTGGTLLCKRAIIQPCIDQNGGSLTFVGVTIDRMPGVDKITELTWSVYNSGALSFIRSPITTPTGTIVRPATIKFTN